MPIQLLELIETRLSDHTPDKKGWRSLMRRASVAMVLRVFEGELNILMIKRAEWEGDPWSGHMAFPGGCREEADAHDFAVAVRETEEELGLTLGEQGQYIGRLSDVITRPPNGSLGMAITPFVFRLEQEVSFTPNEEVAEVVWVPLEFLLDTDNREQMEWAYKGKPAPMPCYLYGGRRIWGLSLIMLDELMDLVEGKSSARPPWRRP